MYCRFLERYHSLRLALIITIIIIKKVSKSLSPLMCCSVSFKQMLSFLFINLGLIEAFSVMRSIAHSEYKTDRGKLGSLV